MADMTESAMSKRSNIFAQLAASNHAPGEREKDDFYATDPAVIDKLLTKETLKERIWEPACGQGHLSRRLEEYGHKVYSTDIRDRGYEKFDGILDFLTADCNPYGATDIVTNPPFKYAEEFVMHGLEIMEEGCKLCLFEKLTFLEGKGRYNSIYSTSPPLAIHVFSERVHTAMDGDFEKYAKGGAVAYAWYVWQKGYTGSTVLDWI